MMSYMTILTKMHYSFDDFDKDVLYDNNGKDELKLWLGGVKISKKDICVIVARPLLVGTW